MNGNEAIVRLLLGQKDVQADSQDDEDLTPLSYAELGKHEIVARLLR